MLVEALITSKRATVGPMARRRCGVREGGSAKGAVTEWHGHAGTQAGSIWQAITYAPQQSSRMRMQQKCRLVGPWRLHRREHYGSTRPGANAAVLCKEDKAAGVTHV